MFFSNMTLCDYLFIWLCGYIYNNNLQTSFLLFYFIQGQVYSVLQILHYQRTEMLL